MTIDFGGVGPALKSTLVITLVGQSVAVKDSTNGGGGNVRCKGNKKIQWTNLTGSSCTLAFLEFLEVDEGGAPGPNWPFKETASLEGHKVVIGNALSWTGTTRRGTDLLVKYTVTVADPQGPFELDPIIIVEK